MRPHRNSFVASFPFGFTLIEVLIALAILSIALAATMRATAMATTSAEEVKLRTYATWVAQNRAAELSARRIFPSVGSENGQIDMGGIDFRWTATTSETPNSAFRKVEIAVTRSSDATATRSSDATATRSSDLTEARKFAVITIYLSRPVDTPSAGAPS